jgi:nitronate monooxygenase
MAFGFVAPRIFFCGPESSTIRRLCRSKAAAMARISRVGTDAKQAFAALTGVSLPLMQSGMGGVAQARLAVAVAEAGGLGVIGLYRHTPEEIQKILCEASGLTDRRIGVNFVPFVLTDEELAARLDIVLQDARSPVITFFGLPAVGILRRAAAHSVCGVQVGSLADAEDAFAGGADFVVLQSSRAGGHHLGTLDHEALLATFATSALAGRVVLLSGGISTSKDVAEAIAAGFSGVLCGTVFATAAESHAHPDYKNMIVASRPEDTIITDAFSIGWHTHRHRVIRNHSCDRQEPAGIIGSATYFGKTHPILRYSVAVPTDATTGAIAEMALYCGTSCAGVSAIEPARDIVRRLADGL